MKSLIYLFTFFFAISTNAQKNIHYRWNKMLQKYVSETGIVNYKEWIQEKDNLDAYVKTLEGMPPRETASKNQKLAYWINAYNALTVQLILDHYPLKSIKEIKSPWDTKCFTTLGKEYTLGDIEHKILRKMDEPRIHFAINCASASCPKLLNVAFQEKELEKQLVEVTKAFLKDNSKNEINPDHLKLSRIFIWFAKDFGSKTERLAFIERYSEVTLKKPKTDYLPYDWSLNE